MIIIHRAENREITEDNNLRILSNTEHYQNHKIAFFEDVAVNEYSSYKKVVKKSGYLILLPIKNGFRINLNGFKWRIEVNQLFVYYLEEGSEFDIEGDEQLDYTYFISIFIHNAFHRLKNVIKPFQVVNDNRFHQIYNHPEIKLFLGGYGLSKKDELPLKNKEHNWLLLSIEGDFEINDRLIETGDLLEINQNNYIDFECLSTESMLLAIEY